VTAPIRPSGPSLRSVITVRLTEDHGGAVPPRLTTEHGGLTEAPPRSTVRLVIGDARTFYAGYADYIIGALMNAAEIEVVGTDPQGVTETRRALAAAFERARRRSG
jgi:hypothetical protein